MTLAEWRQKRGQAIQQMRAIQDKADKEGRKELTAEEQAQWDLLDKEQEELRAKIEALEKEDQERRRDPEQRAARLAELSRGLSATTDSGQRPQPGAPRGGEQRSVLEAEEYRAAFDLYLRGEYDARDVRAAVERRADTLQVGLFAKAGALVMPVQMAEGLIKDIDNQTFMLGLSDVQRITSAESLGVLTLDTDIDDADWTVELKTGNQGDVAVGKRSLTPHPISKRTKVSNTLLRKTAGGAGALVNGRMAYKFGITLEKGCMTGSGVRQPLGVFTAHADGIPTTRDVSTGNSSTSIGADGLIEAKHTVKAAYWPDLNWIFHRDAVKQIRKLKDGNGQYLWQPGLSGDVPERILEVPYKVSEYAPNTFTTGLYVGIIGAFKRGYIIVIALDMTVQRLEELYAETNQTGFIGRMEADGAPVLAEAFARVKLA